MMVSMTDERGTITWTEDPRWCRAYWLTRVPEGQVRGVHAHRETTRFFVCLRGNVNLSVQQGGIPEEVVLGATHAYEVKPMAWTTLSKFAHDTILLVLADKPYDRGEMIFDFEEWKKEVAK